MDFSNEDLKKELGSVAILEGDFSIDSNGYLPDIQAVLGDNIKLEIMNVYREHEQLLGLPKNKIDTILMESTFTYQDKIYDVAKVLVELYRKTKWKPKKVVNTMDYGLHALWYICSKLDIEVYRITDADDFDIGDFRLEKAEVDDEFKKVEISMKYDWFDELFEGLETRRNQGD